MIQAGTGNLTNVTISVPGFTFTDIILNPSNGSGTATSRNAWAPSTRTR